MLTDGQHEAARPALGPQGGAAGPPWRQGPPTATQLSGSPRFRILRWGAGVTAFPRAASGDEAAGEEGAFPSQQPTVGAPWGCRAVARAAWGCSGGSSTLQDPRSRAQPSPCLALAPQPRGQVHPPPRPTPRLGRAGGTPGRSPGPEAPHLPRVPGPARGLPMGLEMSRRGRLGRQVQAGHGEGRDPGAPQPARGSSGWQLFS